MKYLMKSLAVFAVGAAIVSCNDKDVYSSEAARQAHLAEYQDKFVETFGEPNANQTWGFGSSSTRATRAAMPQTPTFRDTNPITKPTMPSYSNTVPANAKYAKDYQNYQNGDIIYIDSEYSTLNNPQNTENLTIYVDGDVKFLYSTNQNSTKIVVTENSTLRLGSVSNNLTVYLAPGATLDLTQKYEENVISWWPYESEIVNSAVESITFQNSNAAIYMNAGSTVKVNNLSLTNGVKVLNAGGTIEANNITLDQESTLWNEGAFTVENTLTLMNTNSSFYNALGKTITVKGNMDLINNNALLYNEGTVNVTGNIVLHNTDAEVVNNGTLTGASYSQAAGGKTHNVGTVTISGKTDLTNSNSKWKNDGQWTCGSFDIDNYSHANFNNCKLTVNGQFFLNHGTFILDAGASAICESFQWEDTSDFHMGSKSLLKVNGTLLTNNYNSGYGFRGYGDEYAVIEANAITHNGNEQFRMSYYGNLYIATDNHFAQWYKDAPNTNQPSYWYENSVKFKFAGDESPVYIPESECNPGYGGGGEETIREQGRIMCEDLGTIGDFDFNDVVFDAIIYEKDGEVTRVEITLLAAGGTMELTIAGQEVHNLFGVPVGPTESMINTGITRKDYVNFTADVKYEHLIDIPIVVKGTDNAGNVTYYELTAEMGKAPQKICVPIGTEWCDEYVSIEKAYPTFKDWVEGEDPFDWSWIQSKVAKYVDLILSNND